MVIMIYPMHDMLSHIQIIYCCHIHNVVVVVDSSLMVFILFAMIAVRDKAREKEKEQKLIINIPLAQLYDLL